MRWPPYFQIILMLFIFSFAFLIPAVSKAETIPTELCSAPYRGFCTDEEEAGPDGYFEPSPWIEEPTRTGGKRWVVRGKNMVVASCPDGRLGKLKVEKITCPGGCLNGECECLDTDVNDYGKSRSDVKGTTTGAIGLYGAKKEATHEDFCTTFLYEGPGILSGKEADGAFYPFGSNFKNFEMVCPPIDPANPPQPNVGQTQQCYKAIPPEGKIMDWNGFDALKKKFEGGDNDAYGRIRNSIATVDPMDGKNKGNAVIEGLCSSSSLSLAFSPCAEGCADGHCLRSCKDSDGGNTPTEAGTAQGVGASGEFIVQGDFCVDRLETTSLKISIKKDKEKGKEDEGTHVVEGVCEETGKGEPKMLEPQRCIGGCKGGKCVHPCKLIEGREDSKKRVVFIAADFQSYQPEPVEVFRKIIEDGFNKIEPFKSTANQFSFWYIDAKIPHGEIIYNFPDDEGGQDKAVQQLAEVVNKYSAPCGPRDITIFITGEYGWDVKNPNPVLITGKAGFVPDLGIPILFSSFKSSIQTTFHELGHGFCGLGHSHGGRTSEKRIPPNCIPLTQFPDDLSNGKALSCPPWDKDLPKPNCFQGCSNNDKLARSTFSSIMGYSSLQGIPDNPAPQKFNILECSACLSKISNSEFQDNIKICRGLPGILGHTKNNEFTCEVIENDQFMECMALAGDCGSYCVGGTCRLKSKGTFCKFPYVASKYLYYSPFGGNCDKIGRCLINRDIECDTELDCRFRGISSSCLQGCVGGKCNIQPDGTKGRLLFGKEDGTCCKGLLCPPGVECKGGVCQFE
ncbi:hypothetical protein HYV84_03925 [Candidatus Woesearchaeota archaeon]|nr:hypothetical protein [Candidatus Woesearchaeota archaeon]